MDHMQYRMLQGFFAVHVLVFSEAFFFKKIWFLPLGNRNYPLCTWKTNELQGEQGLHGTEKCQNPPQMKSPAQKEERCFEEVLEKKKNKRKPTPE